MIISMPFSHLSREPATPYAQACLWFARTICVTPMICGLATAAAAKTPPAAPAVPRTINEIVCPKPFTLPGMEDAMLKPGAKVPTFTVTPEMLAPFKKILEGDPAQLCRYREENRLLPSPRGDRVIFMGDSITEGWKRAAPGLFNDGVIDRGIAGQDTNQMLLRFRADVLDLKPRVVHIMAGVNDLNAPAGTPLTVSNITSMIELAQAHGISVILASITPSARFWTNPSVIPGPQIVELNRRLKTMAAQRGVAWVDYHKPLVDAALGIRSDYSNEGLHPNQKGYDVMTPLAEAAVRRALATPRTNH